MGEKIKTRWFEKYLPFIARSPEMQVKWLVSAFNKGTLSLQEMTPYVRLLLEDGSHEKLEKIAELFENVETGILEKMILAADIYDAPKLFNLFKSPTVAHAVAMLKKSPPPYEKKPTLVFDKVFHAIRDRSVELLENAAETLRKSNEVPDHFGSEYERFKEIMRDEELLSAMFPRAKG